MKAFLLIIIPLFLYSSSFNPNFIPKDNYSNYIYKKDLNLGEIKNHKFNSIKEKLKYEYDLGNNDSGFKYAKILLKEKDYFHAGEILTELIQVNDQPKAFALLGYLFEFGLGVEQNCQKAGLFYLGGISAQDCDSYSYIIKMFETGHCLKNINKGKADKYKFLKLKCLSSQKE